MTRPRQSNLPPADPATPGPGALRDPPRPAPPSRAHPARRAALVFSAAAMLLAGQPALGQSHAPRFLPRSSIAQPPADAGGLLAVVRDESADAGSRAQAARALAQLAADPAAVAGMIDVLSHQPAGSAVPALLAAIAGAPVAPDPAVWPAVSALTASPDAAVAIPALGAAARFGTREAARAILAAGRQTGADPGVRDAAFASLALLTGRADLGSDRGADAEAWHRWLNEAELLTEAQWHRDVSARIAARAAALAADRDRALRELADAQRALYRASPAADRAALLDRLLRDDRDALRSLGFELAASELTRGGAIDAGVVRAVVELLAHSSARTREQAAGLVDQVAPADAGPAVRAALNSETDPKAAAALLAAAARWPDITIRGAVLRWLDEGPPVQSRACLAALALEREGLLKDPADRDRIASALRRRHPETLTGQALRLFSLVGSDQDRAAIAGLLRSETAAVRLAAAEALVDRPEMVGELLDAAASDAALAAAAVRAAAALAPTADTYWRVAMLPYLDGTDRLQALKTLARAMPVDSLMLAALDVSVLDQREALLRELLDRPVPTDPAEAASYAEGVLLLAETLLRQGRPDDALAIIAATPGQSSGAPAAIASVVVAFRVWALTAAGRLVEAGSLGGDAAAWLDGLEFSLGDRHAGALLAIVQDRFGGEIAGDPRLAARLAWIEAVIGAGGRADDDPSTEDTPADSGPGPADPTPPDEGPSR